MRIFLILLVIIPLLSFSQSSVNGRLINKDNEVIPYANILLKNMDSIVVATNISSPEGLFNIEYPEKQKFYLEFYSLGYKKLTKNISASKKNNLGDIVLEKDSRLLDEVVVSSQSPLVESKSDKLVLNVGGSLFARGRTTDELLAYAPFLNVSDGKITLMNSTPIILINNQRVYMSGDELLDYLQSIPAEDIDKIEIYTNPPARFDAEGSGVVNITIKKQALIGVKGYLSAKPYIYTNDTDIWGYKTNAQVSYRDKKWRFSTFVSNSDEKEISRLRNESVFLKNNSGFYNSTKVIGEPISNTIRVKIGNEISENKNILFTYQYTKSTELSTTENTNNLFNSRDRKIDSTIIGNINSSTYSYAHIAGVNYTWDIDTLGQNLTVMGDFYKSDGDENQSIKNSYYNLQEKENPYRKYNLQIELPANNLIASSQVDYTLPIKEGLLSSGAKISSSRTSSQTNYFNLDDGIKTKNNMSSIDFSYNENIAAIYTSFAYKTLSIGIRYESTNATYLNNLDKGKPIDKSYNGFFPNISFGYPVFKERDYVSISYNRRISRPSYQEFNLLNYMSENQIVIGNPNIKPSFPSKVQLMYNLMKKYTLVGEFRYIKDDSNPTILTKDNKVIVQNRNWDNYYQYLLMLNINESIFDWWNVNIDAFSLFNKIDSKFDDIEDVNATGFYSRIKISNNFKVYNWNLELNYFYEPKNHYGPFIMGEKYNVYFVARRNLLKNKLSLSIGVNDLFNSYNNPIFNEIGDVYVNIPFQRRGRICFVNLRYNFNYGKKKVKDINIKSSMKDELERAN